MGELVYFSFCILIFQFSKSAEDFSVRVHDVELFTIGVFDFDCLLVLSESDFVFI